MSANSKIEWTDHTFNPWVGCTKISPACDHCYAERSTPSRALGVQWGPNAPRHRTSAANWELPRRWNAQAEAFFTQHGRRQRVFCASLADVFDNQVPQFWRTSLFGLIYDTPNLDWLLLTKRIGNAAVMLRTDPPESIDMAKLPNLWLGATICNQAEADRDIPKLLATPAAKRFLSMEPLLGPVDLTDLVQVNGPGEHHFSALECDVDPADDEWDGATVDWVIVGGESGPGARPMHPDWARGLRDQCQVDRVPFFFKQWGEWVELDTGAAAPLVARERDPEFVNQLALHDGFISLAGHFVTDPDLMVDDVAYRGLKRIGKKAAGRLLDGREWNEVPTC